ncbi:hypothetical protein GCM10022224_004470 [Nonomuraea antimicrobica]|uniref:Uncharacterized protein n=1 Tax=Nonomuraea antimicrobica TaxID=561173 RepID=A0ABP7B1V9_9ACTN
MPLAPAMTGRPPSSRAVCEAYDCRRGTGPDPTVKLSPTNITTGASRSAGDGGTAPPAEVLPHADPDSIAISRANRVRPGMTTSGR